MVNNNFVPIIASNVLSQTVPSCAFVVTSPAGIIDSGAAGQADLASFRPATTNTAYHLFSATKLYTADKRLGMLLMTNGYGIAVNQALSKACDAITADLVSRSK